MSNASIGGGAPFHDIDIETLQKQFVEALKDTKELTSEALEAQKGIARALAIFFAGNQEKIKKKRKPMREFFQKVEKKPEMAEKEEGVKAGIKEKKATLEEFVQRFPELNLRALKQLKQKFEKEGFDPDYLRDSYPDAYIRSQVIEALKGVTENKDLQDDLDAALSSDMQDRIAKREIMYGALTDQLLTIEEEGVPDVAARKSGRHMAYELMGLERDEKGQTVEIKGLFNVAKTMQAGGYTLKDMMDISRKMSRLGDKLMKDPTMVEPDKRAQLQDVINRYKTMAAVMGAIHEQKRHIQVPRNMLLEAGLEKEVVMAFTPERFAWFVLAIAEQRYNSAENCDKMAEAFVNKTIAAAR